MEQANRLCCIEGCSRHSSIRNYSCLRGTWNLKQEYKNWTSKTPLKICTCHYNDDLRTNPRDKQVPSISTSGNGIFDDQVSEKQLLPQREVVTRSKRQRHSNGNEKQDQLPSEGSNGSSPSNNLGAPKKRGRKKSVFPSKQQFDQQQQQDQEQGLEETPRKKQKKESAASSPVEQLQQKQISSPSRRQQASPPVEEKQGQKMRMMRKQVNNNNDFENSSSSDVDDNDNEDFEDDYSDDEDNNNDDGYENDKSYDLIAPLKNGKCTATEYLNAMYKKQKNEIMKSNKICLLTPRQVAQKRALPCTTVIYNLSNDPCLKYCLETVHQVSKPDPQFFHKHVSFFENDSKRYELSSYYVDDKVVNFSWGLIKNVHAAAAQNHQVNVIEKDLRWNEIQFGKYSIIVRNVEYSVSRMFFNKRSVKKAIQQTPPQVANSQAFASQQVNLVTVPGNMITSAVHEVNDHVHVQNLVHSPIVHENDKDQGLTVPNDLIAVSS